MQFQGPIYTHGDSPAPLPPQGMIVQPEMHLPHPGKLCTSAYMLPVREDMCWVLHKPHPPELYAACSEAGHFGCLGSSPSWVHPEDFQHELVCADQSSQASPWEWC